MRSLRQSSLSFHLDCNRRNNYKFKLSSDILTRPTNYISNTKDTIGSLCSGTNIQNIFKPKHIVDRKKGYAAEKASEWFSNVSGSFFWFKLINKSVM